MYGVGVYVYVCIYVYIYDQFVQKCVNYLPNTYPNFLCIYSDFTCQYIYFLITACNLVSSYQNPCRLTFLSLLKSAAKTPFSSHTRKACALFFLLVIFLCKWQILLSPFSMSCHLAAPHYLLGYLCKVFLNVVPCHGPLILLCVTCF